MSNYESRLKELSDKRKILEKRYEIKMSTLSEFQKIEKQASLKNLQSLKQQSESAQVRNQNLLKQIKESLIITNNSASEKAIHRLNEEKINYQKKVEDLMPQWKRFQAQKLEEKILSLKSEKEKADERRAKLTLSLEKEEKAKILLEKYRQDAILAHALEKTEMLKHSAKDSILEKEKRAMDDIIVEQLSKFGSDLKDKIRNHSDSSLAEHIKGYFDPNISLQVSSKIHSEVLNQAMAHHTVDNRNTSSRSSLTKDDKENQVTAMTTVPQSSLPVAITEGDMIDSPTSQSSRESNTRKSEDFVEDKIVEDISSRHSNSSVIEPVVISKPDSPAPQISPFNKSNLVISTDDIEEIDDISNFDVSSDSKPIEEMEVKETPNISTRHISPARPSTFIIPSTSIVSTNDEFEVSDNNILTISDSSDSSNPILSSPGLLTRKLSPSNRKNSPLSNRKASPSWKEESGTNEMNKESRFETSTMSDEANINSSMKSPKKKENGLHDEENMDDANEEGEIIDDDEDYAGLTDSWNIEKCFEYSKLILQSFNEKIGHSSTRRQLASSMYKDAFENYRAKNFLGRLETISELFGSNSDKVISSLEQLSLIELTKILLTVVYEKSRILFPSDMLIGVINKEKLERYHRGTPYLTQFWTALIDHLKLFTRVEKDLGTKNNSELFSNDGEQILSIFSLALLGNNSSSDTKLLNKVQNIVKAFVLYDDPTSRDSSPLSKRSNDFVNEYLLSPARKESQGIDKATFASLLSRKAAPKSNIDLSIELSRIQRDEDDEFLINVSQQDSSLNSSLGMKSPKRSDPNSASIPPFSPMKSSDTLLQDHTPSQKKLVSTALSNSMQKWKDRNNNTQASGSNTQNAVEESYVSSSSLNNSTMNPDQSLIDDYDFVTKTNSSQNHTNNNNNNISSSLNRSQPLPRKNPSLSYANIGISRSQLNYLEDNEIDDDSMEYAKPPPLRDLAPEKTNRKGNSNAGNDDEDDDFEF